MAEEKVAIKRIVRFNNTDLNGNEPIGHALTKVKGIKNAFANAMIKTSNIDPNKRTGELSGDELKLMADILAQPKKYNIPSFMLNRQRDMETNEDYQYTDANLTFREQNDMKLMQKIRSYKGMRHKFNKTVRGQRTKAGWTRPPFRIHRRGTVLGVVKKKLIAPVAAEGAEEKK